MLDERYSQAVSLHEVASDPAQRQLVLKLDQLLAAFEKNAARGFLSRLFIKRGVRGLYIWGGVGRGKTMLMDMFFEALNIQEKRRVHFHAFMRDVHQGIFEERQRGTQDPLHKTAARIADQTRVLCFDEFAVTNVADAMILSRLFGVLFERGVTVVATSNIPPDALYKDGLNRPLFVPFIALMRKYMDVVELKSARDFRLEKFEKSGVYFTGDGAQEKFDAAWLSFTRGAVECMQQLGVKGRTIEIPRAIMGAARLKFADICETALGTEDYLELARAFHTIFLEGIPFFEAEQRNSLRRFINLIDVFYDNGVNLIALAAGEPKDLVKNMDGYEAEAYQRTASRLIEMRSNDYLSRPHLPGAETLERQGVSG